MFDVIIIQYKNNNCSDNKKTPGNNYKNPGPIWDQINDPIKQLTFP